LSKLDIQRGEDYYEAIVQNIKRYYLDKGYSEEEASKIAHATATKILTRKVGPSWARRILRRIRKKRM